MVFCTLEKSTAADKVVTVPLVAPVMFSPLENVPVGIVIAKLVAEGTLVIWQVAPLVPPVIVSPTVKLAEAATVMVKVPPG